MNIRNAVGILSVMGVFFTFQTAPVAADDFKVGDAEKGKKQFKKCAGCHMIGEGAKNKVGPMLTGIVGRTAGSVEGYKYGKSLKKAGENGLVWSEEELFAYLKNPKKFVRAKLDDKKAKSKMSFKLKKEKHRNNLIAYLKTFQAADAAGSDTGTAGEKKEETKTQ